MKKLKAGILAATGSVGQRFIQLLADHPWFEISALTGSSRTAGRPYRDGVNWILEGHIPAKVADMLVQPTEPNIDADIIFSALPSAEARELEPKFAQAGYPLLTNASPYRMDPYVPLLIPEVNPEHSGLIAYQKAAYGWDGFIVANANCATTGIVLPLHILHQAIGLDSVIVTTMQAISGAGYPGVPSMDILGNVIPYISNEDDKMESEPRKLCGTFTDGGIQLAPFKIGAQANRVPVVDGHLASISAKFSRQADLDEVENLFSSWEVSELIRSLPSSPGQVLQYRTEPNRPQPRLDKDNGAGLAWTVGGIRPCPVFDVRFMSLTHNTLRGAASGSVLNAELLVRQGLIEMPQAVAEPSVIA